MDLAVEELRRGGPQIDDGSATVTLSVGHMPTSLRVVTESTRELT
jgi:hypothetical protein